jgi:hypothetical protein
MVANEYAVYYQAAVIPPGEPQSLSTFSDLTRDPESGE